MIDFEYIKTKFSYNPITGLFTRLSDNIVITTKDSKGYIVLIIDGKQILAHRVAFLFMGKELPEEVDHKDNIRHNNEWENLRPATRQQQCFNTEASINNTSGYKGVHWHKRKNRWVATIRINGVKKHLGMFTDIHDAGRAYQKAALEYHGEFAKF